MMDGMEDKRDSDITYFSDGYLTPRDEFLTPRNDKDESSAKEDYEILQERKRLTRQIAPMTVVPSATAVSMMYMGSHKITGDDCHFPLEQFFIWSGIFSLALLMLGISGSYAVKWMLDAQIRIDEMKPFLKFFKRFGVFLGLCELLLVTIGGLITAYFAAFVWQSKDKTGDGYCDYTLMLFAIVYYGLCWIFMLMGLIFYIGISFYEIKSDKRIDDNEEIKENAFEPVGQVEAITELEGIGAIID